MTERAEYACDICHSFIISPAIYGEFLKDGTIDVHYYCLLSATDLAQKGRLNNKLKGFLVKDVEKLITDIKNDFCFCCKKGSAAIKCSYEGCENKWHYKCGRGFSCITQFIGQFKSFCNKHLPVENVRKHNEVFCCTCFMILTTNDPTKCIFSTCCKDEEDIAESFQHFNCIQKYVVNAGYDSKCVTCPMKSMTKEEWQDQMRKRGVFVPMQMAAWETGDYFSDQIKNKCEAENCQYPNSKCVWTCFVCGCFPLHLKCARVKTHEEYLCPKCYDQSFLKLIPTTSKRVSTSK